MNPDVKKWLEELFSIYEGSEVKDFGSVIVCGYKVDETEVVDAAEKTIIEWWVEAAYQEGWDHINFCILKHKQDPAKDWWDGQNSVTTKKQVKIDGGDYTADCERVLVDLIKQASEAISKIKVSQSERLKRFQSEESFRDYDLTIDVARAKSGRVIDGGYLDWGEQVDPRKTSDTTRVIERDGKKVLQWVNPDTHRWEDVRNERVLFPHYDEIITTFNIRRGKFRVLGEKEQSEFKTFKTTRFLISDETARKLFREILKHDVSGGIMLLRHNSNQKIELFVGNDISYEPIGNWTQRNRSYIQTLRKQKASN